MNLLSTAFVPHEGLDESFHFFASNVRDHVATAAHNLSPGRRDPLMLEQSAFSLTLSSDQAEQLQKLARRLWTNALRQFLQAATVVEQRSEGSDGLRAEHKIRRVFSRVGATGARRQGKTPTARSRARKPE